MARKLEIDFPGRAFVVIPVGRLDPPREVTRGIDPDFQKFDRGLKTQVRPVPVSLGTSALPGFHRSGVLGRTLTIGAGGCVSVFQGSSLTLGQMADAFMLAAALTSIRKRSQLDSGHAGAVFVRSNLQLVGSGLGFCDSQFSVPLT